MTIHNLINLPDPSSRDINIFFLFFVETYNLRHEYGMFGTITLQYLDKDTMTYTFLNIIFIFNLFKYMQ